MTPAELTAYRELCRRWPECDPGFDYSEEARGFIAWESRFLRPSDFTIEAVAIHHLESTILSKHAPGWEYGSPHDVYPSHVYEIPMGEAGRCEFVIKDSRLSACIEACAAVLTAKGKSDA